MLLHLLVTLRLYLVLLGHVHRLRNVKAQYAPTHLEHVVLVSFEAKLIFLHQNEGTELRVVVL